MSRKPSPLPPIALKEVLPREIPPMLATRGDRPFTDADWAYEPKLDGYRILAWRSADEVRLITRGGVDLSEAFPDLVAALRDQPFHSLVVDGELVGFDRAGRPSFEALQSRSKVASRAGDNAVLFCFDLLHRDGHNLRGLPYTERRNALQQCIDFSRHIQLVHAQDDGRALFHAAAEMGMEGVIAKRKESVYQPGVRSSDWLKILAFKRADLLVIGYTGKSKVEALVVGYRRQGKLHYAGQVNGLGKLSVSLLPVLKSVPDAPAVARIADIRWITPMLTCEVRYRELTGDGKLRHPTFYRMRDEIAPASGDFPEDLPP